MLAPRVAQIRFSSVQQIHKCGLRAAPFLTRSCGADYICDKTTQQQKAAAAPAQRAGLSAGLGPGGGPRTARPGLGGGRPLFQFTRVPGAPAPRGRGRGRGAPVASVPRPSAGARGGGRTLGGRGAGTGGTGRAQAGAITDRRFAVPRAGNHHVARRRMRRDRCPARSGRARRARRRFPRRRTACGSGSPKAD